MEEQTTDLGLQKSVNLERGIFIVRYSAAEDEAFPPKVTIGSGPGSEANVLPVLHPEEQEPVLWQPGTALVVQAVEPGLLLVQVAPTRPRGSAVATVKIETLSQGKPGVNVTLPDLSHGASVSTEPRAAEFSTDDFRMLGHVAGRGDVFVGANEWIGGPAAPSRIEGLAIEWPTRPRGLTLRYAVTTPRPDVTSNAPVEVGTFVGSRGHALPLLGVMFELSGTSAPRYELVAETAFLGAPITRARGDKLTLTGPTGREALVGIRLKIEQISGAAQPKSPPPKPAQATTPGRVRVFRSTNKG
ncbi:MAG: hypothetical protein JO230_32745 [Xanthobacteraceae bacterium]|nr:hypothetical protein [Xanthobacteraceae bacterium]